MRFILMKLKALLIALIKMEVEPQIRMSYHNYLLSLDILSTMNNLKKHLRIQILTTMVLLISKNFLVGISQGLSLTMMGNVICFFWVTLVFLSQKHSLLTKFSQSCQKTNLLILLKLNFKLTIPRMALLYKLKLISQVQSMKSSSPKKMLLQHLKELNFLKTPTVMISLLVLLKLMLL